MREKNVYFPLTERSLKVQRKSNHSMQSPEYICFTMFWMASMQGIGNFEMVFFSDQFVNRVFPSERKQKVRFNILYLVTSLSSFSFSIVTSVWTLSRFLSGEKEMLICLALENLDYANIMLFLLIVGVNLKISFFLYSSSNSLFIIFLFSNFLLFMYKCSWTEICFHLLFSQTSFTYDFFLLLLLILFSLDSYILSFSLLCESLLWIIFFSSYFLHSNLSSLSNFSYICPDLASPYFSLFVLFVFSLISLFINEVQPGVSRSLKVRADPVRFQYPFPENLSPRGVILYPSRQESINIIIYVHYIIIKRQFSSSPPRKSSF